MINNLEIYSATEEDAKHLVYIRDSSWFFNLENKTEAIKKEFASLDRGIDFYVKSIQENHYITIAEKDNKRIGFSHFGPLDDPIYTCFYHSCQVLPKYHNQGIGSLLFKIGANKVIDNGHKNLIYWILKENTLSLERNKKRGAKIVREIKTPYVIWCEIYLDLIQWNNQ